MTVSDALNLSACFAAYGCTTANLPIAVTVCVCLAVAAISGFAGYCGVSNASLASQ